MERVGGRELGVEFWADPHVGVRAGGSIGIHAQLLPLDPFGRGGGAGAVASPAHLHRAHALTSLSVGNRKKSAPTAGPA